METLPKDPTAHREGEQPFPPGSLVVLALDARASEGGKSALERAYFVCRGADVASGGLKRWNPEEPLPVQCDAGERTFVYVYPTTTYSEGFGGALFSDIAPEDRRMLRILWRRRPGGVACSKVRLCDTALFEGLADFFFDEGAREKYRRERAAVPAGDEPKAAERGNGKFVEFTPKYLANVREIFASCMTKPNRQDYMYLVTKTFGLNLALRLAFMAQGVMKGGLPLTRAVASTSWYQAQDAVFTVFGQTYMKFLGKMTGMLRVWNMHVGDFAFVYVQLCLFEFLNRLVLGPLGENPLVYTWSGMGLIFVNILQGMLSGGPLIPAINKMRKVGVIGHSTMMHLYQLTSLTMHFGLFATFGFQKFYALLTGATLAFSWSGYMIFSAFFKDPEFIPAREPRVLSRLDALAALATGCRRV